MEADAVDSRNTDGSANDFPHFHQLAHQLFVVVQNLLRSLVDAVSFAGKLELLYAAIDKKVIEVFLHCSGLLANSGLSDSVKASSFRKAFRFNEIDEDLKIVDLHSGDVEVETQLY